MSGWSSRKIFHSKWNNLACTGNIQNLSKNLTKDSQKQTPKQGKENSLMKVFTKSKKETFVFLKSITVIFPFHLKGIIGIIYFSEKNITFLSLLFFTFHFLVGNKTFLCEGKKT